jgi:hypothetical protein
VTVHVTWEGVLAFVGAGALSLYVLRALYGLVTLWLFTRKMRGK